MIKTMAMKRGGIDAEVTAEDVVAAYYEYHRRCPASIAYDRTCAELVEMLAGEQFPPTPSSTRCPSKIRRDADEYAKWVQAWDNYRETLVEMMERYRHLCYALREAHYGDQTSGDSPPTPEWVWEKRKCRGCGGTGVIHSPDLDPCSLCDGSGFRDAPEAREEGS